MPLQKFIQRHLCFLEEELDMFYLKDRFIETKVFSEAEIASVSASDTRRKRSHQLLLMLSKKDEDTLKAFLHVLLDANEEYVLQHLLDESKQTGQEMPLQKFIQRHLCFLEEELDMFYLKDRFTETKVFSEAEIASVSASDTRRKRSHQLLLMLSKKDEDTLKAFLHVLLDANEDYVLQHLLDESKQTDEDCRPGQSESARPVHTKQAARLYEYIAGLPVEIVNWDQKSIDIYNRALQEGTEEHYNFPIMVVGQCGVGKTTLINRLLGNPVNIEEYNTTVGIDIHQHVCRINVTTGKWEIAPITSRQQSIERSVRVLQQHQRKRKSLEEPKSPTKRMVTDSTCRGETPMETETSLAQSCDENMFQSNVRAEIPGSSAGQEIHQEPTSPTEIMEVLRPIVEEAQLEQYSGNDKFATVSIYDFAGQAIFHSPNMTFMSPRAVYVLVVNVNMMKDEMVTDDEYLYDILGPKTQTVEEHLIRWLNAIYVYAQKRQTQQPNILLVGTHADKIPVDKREIIIETFFESIRQLLVRLPVRVLLVDKEFAVDNTNENDPGFQLIRDKIYETARNQAQWGQKVPAKWLPLEQKMNDLKTQGKKIISFRELKSISRSLPVNIEEAGELTTLLRLLHETGEIIFYDDFILRDTIILDPSLLIGALKYIITSPGFLMRTEVGRELAEFKKSGVISAQDLKRLFRQKESNVSFRENADHIVLMLERYHFIAQPLQSNTSDTESQTNAAFIVPAMLKEIPDPELTVPCKDRNMKTTSVLCLVSKERFLPVAAFHKLLACCITKWSISEISHKRQIFCGLGTFNLDKTKKHRLTIYLIKYAVHIFVTCVSPTDPDPEICSNAAKYIIETLKSIGTLGMFDAFQTCIKCPDVPANSNDGYLEVEKMESDEGVVCEDHGLHSLEPAHLLKYWFPKTVSQRRSYPDVQSPGISSTTAATTGMNRKVTEHDIHWLGGKIGKEYTSLARELGIPQSKIDQIVNENRHSSREQIFHLLHHWQVQSGDKATLAVLEEAMKNTDMDVTVLEHIPQK